MSPLLRLTFRKSRRCHFRISTTTMAPPPDDILKRMCVGLRVPELQAELRRRGKNGDGTRADLVARLVVCLRSDFATVDSAAAASNAAAEVYHEDTAQPMWGWSDYLKGPKVFLSSTLGAFGVRNAITGCGEQRGGFSGVVSDKVFSNDKHWFRFKAREPATFLHLCFISAVDASKSDQDLKEMCTHGDRQMYAHLGRNASFACLSCEHHIPYEQWRDRNFKETLVCLDTEERRLSFLIDGRLVHLISDIPVPCRVGVWSKFEGHEGTLILRTGITPPL